MKVKYTSVTGTTVSVKVDKELYDVIFEFDEEWRKSDRRESSDERHSRFEEVNDKSEFLEDTKSLDVDEQVFKKFSKDKLYAAISKLKPAEQALLHELYLRKNPISQTELAKIQNISVGSVKMKFQRIKSKLKKLL
ncbi:MAG: hypothetical protein LBR79_07200 [Oscillospiraceae bacterium]|jgi:RNA polymerase sigma factor (sigma-70 family)|nr:hypothetical protein [Oscillospiraceae bacterium]